MKIIISPAKKMKVDTDSMPYFDLPVFLKKTEELLQTLKSMSYEELKRLWKCNDSIAALNVGRLAQMDLYRNLTPAVLSYEGIQYQYMAPGVFTDQGCSYIQEHLRILSGFYGILKPFDGVTPYRLEMQSKLNLGEKRDLYDFWGSDLAKSLTEETDCIINLASKEYSLAVSKYLPKTVRFVSCSFGEIINGKVIEKGTMCKMARGEMVRFMAENQVTSVEQMKDFCCMNYHYAEEFSKADGMVFIK